MKFAKILMTLLIAIMIGIQGASATVDFTALTDLINATFTILSTFVTNSTTLYSFVILMAGLGLIGIIIYGFVGKLFHKFGTFSGKN